MYRSHGLDLNDDGDDFNVHKCINVNVTTTDIPDLTII